MALAMGLDAGTQKDSGVSSMTSEKFIPMKFIPISQPMLVGNESKYVMDCMESGWISSIGKYLGAFEESFATFCEAKHAVTCSNGTTALHLALLALGVEPGD